MASERSRGSWPEDTALTKIFVGGLAWETRRDGLRAHFKKFGEIVDAVVVTDGITGRSRGYGFVTFEDAEAARKACEDPYPVIDGRRGNCNLASLGARKNRPFTVSPHPGWEKWKRRSGQPGFNCFAPPSPWEARAYPPPPYQCPAVYSYSLYTMNYYNTYGGQHFPTYYNPLYQRHGQTTPGTTHYRKSGQCPVFYSQFCRPQLSSASIWELPTPAVTAVRNSGGGQGATSKRIDREQSV